MAEFMKKVCSFLFFVSLIFSGAVLEAGEALSKDKLTLGIMPRNSPPSIIYENGKLSGSDAEVVEAVAKRAGYKVEFSVLPWKRVQQMVEKGALDGAAVGYKTKDRERYGIYTETPISYVSYKVFVKKGDEFVFSGVHDLFGKTVGKPSGFQVYKELDRAAEQGKLNVFESETRKSLLSMLRFGRINAVVGLSKDTQYYIDLEGIDDVVALPHPIQEPQGSYIWFSKAADLAPEVLIRFNAALKEMAEDGSLQKIYSRYGLNYLP